MYTYFSIVKHPLKRIPLLQQIHHSLTIQYQELDNYVLS